MTITLEQAIHLLQSASAVIIDDNVVTYLNPDPEQDPFAQVAWEADEGYFEYSFYKEDNQASTVTGGSLWLVPTNVAGEKEEPMQLTLLEPMQLKQQVQLEQRLEALLATAFLEIEQQNEQA